MRFLGAICPSSTSSKEEILEQNETDFDFEVGHETGTQETLEDVEQRLIDAGHDPEEVEELLYDPAPRHHKGKKKQRSHRSRTQHVRSPAYVYDPAPRKRKVTAKRTGKKGTLAKLKKFAIPGAAGLTFYGGYVKRAEELFTAGKITEKSVFKAIEYDFKNFNGTDAMNRVKSQAGEIIAPVAVGWGIKETKILGKYSGIAADLLTGFGIGVGAKAILDPPITNAGAAKNLITVKKPDCPGCKDQGPQMQMTAYNPYMPGGL
ncbi:MAG: hypothetical protein MPEBLZ_03244 [Candidatus Methanoperedens nitroreducens]|uniref:Uncharacterized protein n=1 Tax=Candidatus Methanoperedens nitratireducens TaxID=1392998 RepID=A0A0N8KQI0_9EURY|nr:MAG: hypothetical protein MPEBLZ_03244 [Candidatus Methanoperedens sp. BLZ1]